MENLLKRGMKSTKCMSDLCESCPLEAGIR